MQSILRKNGEARLARRITRALASSNNENEIIDRVSLTLQRIKQENSASFRLIQKEASAFFRYYNNLWV